MTTRTRLIALLFVGLAAATIAATASADPPKPKLMIAPGFAPGEPYGLPKFGFASSTIPGFGERIVDVRYGGRAYHLGLEPGDVILSLNGYKLTYTGSWNDALRNALYEGNYIRLKVRDVRTGNVYFRETYVDYGGGPVEHYYKTNNHVEFHHDNDFHDDHDVHHVGGTLKTIKEVKKLFD
jgi:hypothetical protein